MGLISRVSSRTYREKGHDMLRRSILRLAKSPELGFPQSRAAFTALKKDEPLENYASWDTQRYVNKGVCFYDLIDNTWTIVCHAITPCERRTETTTELLTACNASSFVSFG